MSKLFVKDGDAVRRIKKFFVDDNGTVRRCRKLFSNIGGTVRRIWAELTAFTLSGTNVIGTPAAAETIRFDYSGTRSNVVIPAVSVTEKLIIALDSDFDGGVAIPETLAEYSNGDQLDWAANSDSLIWEFTYTNAQLNTNYTVHSAGTVDTITIKVGGSTSTGGSIRRAGFRIPNYDLEIGSDVRETLEAHLDTTYDVMLGSAFNSKIGEGEITHVSGNTYRFTIRPTTALTVYRVSNSLYNAGLDFFYDVDNEYVHLVVSAPNPDFISQQTVAPSFRTTFSFDPDTADAIYESEVTTTSFDSDNYTATQALTQIARAAIGLHDNITWDSEIDSDVQGRKYVDIDLGTDSDINASLTVTANSGSNTAPTLTATNGISIDSDGTHTTYTVTDYDGRQVTTFTSSVNDSDSDDIASVVSQIYNAANNNTETPIDFTADSDSDGRLILTADRDGAVTGNWTITVNNHGQTNNAGNIVFTRSVVTEGGDGTATIVTFTEQGETIVLDSDSEMTIDRIGARIAASDPTNIEYDPATNTLSVFYADESVSIANNNTENPLTFTEQED